MFTGMLKVIPNEDSLATILGHEMSHAILQHAVSSCIYKAPDLFSIFKACTLRIHV